jgi:hypothetical protein
MYWLAGRAGEELHKMNKSITRTEIQMDFVETDCNKLLNIVPTDKVVALNIKWLKFKLLAIVTVQVSNNGPILEFFLNWGGSFGCHP